MIEHVIDHTPESLKAQLTVREFSPFVRNGRVGAWVALEYMAQAIAAFAGLNARARGEAPKVGFLIGSRHFSCTVAYLPVGTTLEISVVRQLEDDGGLGLFDGTMTGPGISANATLSVFQPKSVDQFMLHRRA